MVKLTNLANFLELVHWVQVFFFQRLQARKWNNFAIVIAILVFVLNKNISAITNTTLLCYLTLGVSHAKLRLQFQSFFKGSEVLRSEFARHPILTVGDR